jgi:tRNA(Ile)-lysidine synthase
VALSGGIDSVFLLYVFAALREQRGLGLSALHVNHGLSANADHWTDFCVKLCAELAIPLRVSRVKVNKINGEGLENSARQARYREFAMSGAEVMVLAHHRDDQIETLLSQIMRGSDVHNLAGMQSVSRKQEQYLWRPLLQISKAQIKAAMQQNQLSNIEDESNLDCKYLRNFLRNQIIPQLIEFDGLVENRLIQSVTSLQEACALNDELAELDLAAVETTGGLSKNKFLELSLLRQHNLLCYFIRIQQQGLPSKRRLMEFIRQVATAKADRHPALKLSLKDSLLLSKNLIFINHG